MNMTHPDILAMERFGELHPGNDEERVGYCEECGRPIYDDQGDYWRCRAEGIFFCSEDCLCSHFGLEHCE